MNHPYGDSHPLERTWRRGHRSSVPLEQSITAYDGSTVVGSLRFDQDAMRWSTGETALPIRLTNLANPETGRDGTNKDYVDAVARGLVVKQPVRLHSATNRSIVLTPDLIGDMESDALMAGWALDGVPLECGDRVLLSGQADPTENGIWVLGGNSGGLQERTAQRALDLPAGAVATGVYVFVDQGDQFRDQSFVCISDRGATPRHPCCGGDFEPVSSAHIPWNGSHSSLEHPPWPAKDWSWDPITDWMLVGMDAAQAVSTPVCNPDGSTIEVNAGQVKIKNPDVRVKVQRGLLRSQTNGTTIVTANTTDAADVSNLGGTVHLGDNVTLAPDFLVLPDLDGSNTFTQETQFTSTEPAVGGNAARGAMVVMGGMAVGHSVVADNLQIQSTTDSTAVDNGSLVIAGGLGVALNVTCSTAHVTGALVVPGGGVGVAENVHVGAEQHISGNVYVDNTDNAQEPTEVLQGSLQVQGGVAIRRDLQAHQLRVNDVSGSSSCTTGSLRVLGGVGVLGDAWVGQNAVIHGTVFCENASSPATWDASLDLSGSLVVEGGASIRSNLHSDRAAIHGGTDASWDTTLTGSVTTEGGVSVRQTMECLNGRIHATTPSVSQTTGALVVSGGVAVQGNLFCTSTYNMSDARLKRNLTVIEDGLERVCGLNGYTFEWNQEMPGLEHQPSVGVLAQEVRVWAPQCVLQNATTDRMAVEYPKLIPYLIEAIKSLKRKLTDLEDRRSKLSRPV